MVRKIIAFGYQTVDVQSFALALIATAILVISLYFVSDKTFQTGLFLSTHCKRLI